MERDGRLAYVDAGTNNLVSEGNFRNKNASPRPAQWKPAHDLSSYPQLKSGYPLLDRVYALALDKVLEHLEYRPIGLLNASKGRPPWVRDTSYVTLMGGDALFPEPTGKTLEWCIIPGKGIKPEQVGAINEAPAGSVATITPCYNLSDYVLWIPAALQYARTTGDRSLLERHFKEMALSLQFVRERMYDPYDGLYDGGDTIGDGASLYPEDAMGLVPLKGSGTNLIHYRALMAMAEISKWLGQNPEERENYIREALAVKDAVNRDLWLVPQGYFALLKMGRDPYPVERSSLPGNAFALLWNGTDRARAESILAHTPDTPWGAPLDWPPFLNRGAYHDQNIWPVMDGVWSTARARVGQPERLVKSMALMAADGAFQLNLGEMWGAFDGDYRGREPQLWTCMAYLMEIFQGLLGVTPWSQGLMIQPSVPTEFAAGFEISNYPYRKAHYTFRIKGEGHCIASFKVDGIATSNILPPDAHGWHVVEIEMVKELPFRLSEAPEVIGLEPGVTASFKVRTGGSQPLALLVAGQDDQPVKQIPVQGGVAEMKAFDLCGGEPGTIRYSLASINPQGIPLQMEPWRAVEIRPACAVRWDPGVFDFARPIQQDTSGIARIFVKNSGVGEKSYSLAVQSPAGVTTSLSKSEVTIPAGEERSVDLSWTAWKGLAYGTYPFTAEATDRTSGKAETCLANIQVQEKIDLRGVWLVKNLSLSETGERIDLNDRDGNWSYARLPGRWQFLRGFENFSGKMWFRKHVLVPLAWKGHDAELFFNDISGRDVTYFNGTKIGESADGSRTYHILAALVRPGDNNLIAVSVEDSGKKSGLTGWPMELRVKP